jgi:hypothetical protein
MALRVRGRVSHPIRVDLDLADRVRVEAARRRLTIGDLVASIVGPRLVEMEREPVSRPRSRETAARAGQAE